MIIGDKCIASVRSINKLVIFSIIFGALVGSFWTYLATKVKAAIENPALVFGEAEEAANPAAPGVLPWSEFRAVYKDAIPEDYQLYLKEKIEAGVREISPDADVRYDHESNSFIVNLGEKAQEQSR